MNLQAAVARHGSKRAAAKALNIPETTFRQRLKKEQKSQSFAECVKSGRARIRDISHESVMDSCEKSKTVCVIGDFHRSPDKKNDVPKWIGRYLTDMQPDCIVHIGDLGDFDSITRWIEKGSQESKSQATIAQDIEAVAAGFRDFHENYYPDNDVTQHVTLGNHDERLWLWENLNPQSYGMFTSKFTGMIEHYGWSWTPFGQYWNYAGVDFVHAPKHEGGRAISGKTALYRIANDSRRDVVFGHTHKFGIFPSTKLGNAERVTAVNVGCSLPWGTVKDYAKLSASGWWWGVVMLTIYKGRIEGVLAKPMFELEEEYS